jgi:16S rRNA (cytosine1402-N4)-methyltransferase
MTTAPETLAGGHAPVMLSEVLQALAPRDGGIYVDATYGRGGYSRAILEAAECQVYGIDRDPEAVAAGRAMAADYAGRLDIIDGRFGEMDRLLPVAAVDGIALDLGLSSPQIDQAERGFSFRHDGPLDMRMSGSGPSAADAVNSLPERELADILWRLGEERRARQVARAIVAARQQQAITRTGQLAEIVRRVVRPGKDGIDPATRTFQALRIYVNDELGELERGLGAAERLLAPGGRLAVVAFHSLEDRLVKRFLRGRSSAAPRASRHQPEADTAPAATFELLSRQALRPGASECAANPRARSARLRAASRTAAPPPAGGTT